MKVDLCHHLRMSPAKLKLTKGLKVQYMIFIIFYKFFFLHFFDENRFVLSFKDERPQNLSRQQQLKVQYMIFIKFSNLCFSIFLDGNRFVPSFKDERLLFLTRTTKVPWSLTTAISSSFFLLSFFLATHLQNATASRCLMVYKPNLVTRITDPSFI